MTKRVRAAAALVAVPMLAVLTMQSAAAADGKVWAANDAAYTYYTDKGDYVTVCDRAPDGHGAVGWIAVRQSDGSYKNFPRVYQGNGDGHCAIVSQDVLREGSPIKIVSCLIDGPNGTPYGCGTKYIQGS